MQFVNFWSYNHRNCAKTALTGSFKRLFACVLCRNEPSWHPIFVLTKFSLDSLRTPHILEKRILLWWQMMATRAFKFTEFDYSVVRIVAQSVKFAKLYFDSVSNCTSERFYCFHKRLELVSIPGIT